MQPLHHKPRRTGRFIRFVRFCKKDETTFLRTQCRAQMRRCTTYDIDLSLDEQGNILHTQCECAAGMAHIRL
ncbi:hypothetical protein NP493_540g00003 [Ridgeia piscesae]|uniref:Uncharacterized protein n=1 Tax=Ridgeia piscesae TaxID=27915 RepID=A0AAD9KW74_RIDPI|nr:hypothetical protein NP493_540g00003 [Ridgeia piscesae]